MTTFAEEIEQEAGEPIEAVVVGGFGWGDGPDEGSYAFDRNEARKPIPEGLKRIPIDWQTARPYLDYKYSGDFGAPECHAVWVYTRSSLLFVSEYDGATQVERIPRFPIPGEPTMPGGG